MEILNNFSSIYCFIMLIIFAASIFMLVILCIEAIAKKKLRNKVHFYVARDMYSYIYLYLGKPIRRNFQFSSTEKCKCIASEGDFENFNLDIKDFKDLKWEDEPVEVFLNMED